LIEGTLAVRFAELGVGGTRAFWTMFLLSTGATVLGLGLLIAATAVASAGTHIFPRWFAVASAVLVLVSAVGAFTIGYSGNAIQAVAGMAVLLDSVWILVTGLLMWRASSRAAP
jgi:hypothetical protein